jgi:hypothetical protein
MERRIQIDLAPNNPEAQMVVCVWQVASRDHVRFSRRGGAEMGIPTMIGNEAASASRVKAATITTQSNNSP